MDRKRNSERVEPPEQPIEPEMPRGQEEDNSGREPASGPSKEKRKDDL